jgi:hypothetical protein
MTVVLALLGSLVLLAPFVLIYALLGPLRWRRACFRLWIVLCGVWSTATIWDMWQWYHLTSPGRVTPTSPSGMVDYSFTTWLLAPVYPLLVPWMVTGIVVCVRWGFSAMPKVRPAYPGFR